MRQQDIELQRKVVAELNWDPSIRDEEIAVAVRDGVVTLAGQVRSYADKKAAERAAERVSGVRAIADGMQVKLPGTHVRSDTELAHQVVHSLRWHTQVPDERITATVEDGWVTLEGEVDWQYQRNAAERAVRYLSGVRGLTNVIAIRPQLSTHDVSQRIREALRRRAELDSSRIEVETRNGVVTLTGTVRSWLERQDAENAVWAATGVHEIDDRLTVQV